MQRPYLRTHRPLSNGRCQDFILREWGWVCFIGLSTITAFMESRGHDIGLALFCGVQEQSPWKLYDMVYSRGFISLIYIHFSHVKFINNGRNYHIIGFFFFDLVNTKCTVIDIVAIKKCEAGGRLTYTAMHIKYILIHKSEWDIPIFTLLELCVRSLNVVLHLVPFFPVIFYFLFWGARRLPASSPCYALVTPSGF